MTKETKLIIKFSLFTLMFCMCSLFSTQSQVTIGSTSNPLKGALLDLKENDNGDANSTNGMILPRVFLTKIDSLIPMLTGLESDYESLKPAYTGMIVFNVNPNAPFEKGSYIWDGMEWKLMNTAAQKNIVARNGLSLSGSDTIKLGGDLEQNTTINLNDYNLIFSNNQGKIGIGTSDPKAVMQIENPNSNDPLILRNLKFVTDAENAIDSPNPTYYDLKVSENGVLRKVQNTTTDLHQSFVYHLYQNTAIAAGDATNEGATGHGGSELYWNGPGVTNSFITLPEDGAYVFSFSLYGAYTVGSGGNETQTEANSYYISAYKNGTGGTTSENPVDIAEIVINHTPHNTGFTNLSYSINLTVSGQAGDTVHFRMSSYYGRRNLFTWTLTQKTSLIFWRL